MSTPDPLFGVRLMAPGEYINQWGDPQLNAVISLIIEGIAKRVPFALSGTKTLTNNNYIANEARSAFLDVTGGTGGTIVIPDKSKIYLVRNACTGDVIVSTGGGITATVTKGGLAWVVSTGGATVVLVRDAAMATRQYVDDTAFEANAGILPGQAGQANAYLSTDGSVAGWRAFSIATIPLLQTTLDGKEPIDRATAANFRADANAKLLASDAVWDAADFVVITYAAAVTLSFSAFFNARINLTGNITFNAPTNLKPGQSGVIKLVQDATGSRLATFNAAFKFGSGIKTLSTGPSQIDYLSYVIDDAGNVICNLTRAPS